MRPNDPIVEGIKSFNLMSEQYFMLTDASNEVLATTTFSGEHLWWIEGTVVPVIWKRRWDKGRIFYCSIGQRLDDLKVSQVTEII
jgi:type 1 glutamine amidotransferase